MIENSLSGKVFAASSRTAQSCWHCWCLHILASHDLARRVAAAGEPFAGFFDPKDLAHKLQTMGFRHIEDLDAAQIDARYFSGR